MRNGRIRRVTAHEVIDSRGIPTVLAQVRLEDGSVGEASVPSGASTGAHEAHEKRDVGAKRYFGRGVMGTVSAVSELSRALEGECATRQERIDNIILEVDGTRDKSSLGANLTLAVSLACARAAAVHANLALYRYLGGAAGGRMPVPLMNILNGGAHASNNIDLQEFMIAPVGIDSIAERIRCGCEVYGALKSQLNSRGLSTAVGDEGGFAPTLSSEREALDLIVKSIEAAGYSTDDVKIALDAASSEWCKSSCGEGACPISGISEFDYVMPKSGRKFDSSGLIKYFNELVRDYPIVSIEDPLGEDDFAAWSKMTASAGTAIALVGDDLFVTNAERLKRGIDERAANSILIKPNQIGTLSETLETISLARSHGFGYIISHRSGDTEDTFIADLAVAVNAPFIKTGAPCRSERVAKYNRLIMIENEVAFTRNRSGSAR